MQPSLRTEHANSTSSQGRLWKELLLAFLGYAFIVLVIFAPFFLRGFTFLPVDCYLMAYKPFAEGFPAFRPFNHFDDDILKFYFQYQEQAKLHPYHPFWVPEIFGGIAMYANTYAAHFSTLNWMLLLGPVGVTYPMRLLTFVWIAGISMFSLAREMGGKMLPAFLAGLSYMLASIFMTLLLRWWEHAPFSWFPLVLLFSWRGMREISISSVFWAATFLACSFLDGFFQSSASILLALGIFLLVVGWKERNFQGLLRAVGLGLFILALAGMFSAIMWLPQLEYFREDMAKGSSRAAGLYYGKNLIERLLSLPLLVSALFPALTGNVRGMDLAKLAKSHLQDFSLFVGTIPLLLGLGAWKFRARFHSGEWGMWALVFAGLAVPILTPLDRFLYFRFFAVYVTGISLLGALGWQHFAADVDRKTLQKLATTAGILLGLIFVASAGLGLLRLAKPGWLEQKARDFVSARLDQSTLGSRNPDWMFWRAENAVKFWSLGSWEYNLALFLAALAVAACWLWARKKIQDRIFSGLVLLLTFAQLFLFVRTWHGFHDPRKFPLFPENEISDFLHREDPGMKYRATTDDFHGIGRQKQIIPANSNLSFGYTAIDGFDGVRPWTVYDIPSPITDYGALAEKNVRYLLTNPEPKLTDPRLKLRHRGRVAIYEISGAKSRGQIFFDYDVHTRAEMIERLLEGKPFGPRPIWLEHQPSLAARESSPEETVLLSSDYRSSVYRLNNRQPGIFVASESFYPGWKAELNGKPVEIIRANASMRAVEVPAGGGELVFRFEPDSYRYGLLISIISFGSAVFALFTGKFVRFMRKRRGVAIA